MGKKHNREDKEDRCFPYRDFRWKMNFGAVQAADHIEYTKINNQIVYVSVMELTLVEVNAKYPEPNKAYLKAIIDRYDKEMQGIFIKKLAETLNVSAFIILFDQIIKINFNLKLFERIKKTNKLMFFILIF